MLNALILVASTILFLYWFRHTCRLILTTRASKDFSAPIVAANQLGFPDIRKRLPDEPAERLDDLLASLQKDYRLLTYLFSHSADLSGDGQELERRMLIADYWVMRAWYRLSRRYSARQARAALDEMAQIVWHFANSIGQHWASNVA